MTETVRFYINELNKRYETPLLSRNELAEVLTISVSTLDTLIRKEELPIRHRRVGNSQKAKYGFPILEVANYLAFQPAA